MATGEPKEKSVEAPAKNKSSILCEPMRPGGMRICPNCGQWFALKYVSTRKDKLAGRIDLYRCKKCGKEMEYSEKLPPRVV
ncbi:MAG: hypothetical protein KKE86_09290 [Planctomycetes bacterium]|nr:hypothetical protein [Planctomycetota bacterium]MBU4399514.1 hypothetical protein [Planctomycetota bacterium]MCG2684558.1 hypothetical protein [Planctomycetales bacterium]